MSDINDLTGRIDTRRTRIMRVMVSEPEYELIREMAEAEGRTISGFVRWCVLTEPETDDCSSPQNPV